MACQSTLKLKRGDTFFFHMSITLGDGITPLVVTVDKLKCQIRKVNDVLVDTLTVETTSTAGTYLFTASATDTLTYPLEDLQLDVKVMDGSITVSTETLIVEVDKDVTKWL